MLWCKIDSEHEFILWYEINKCHESKINNHNFPWVFIRWLPWVLRIDNSWIPWACNIIVIGLRI